MEENQKRWARLARNQLWIVPDLLFLFTKWDSVFEAVKAQLHSAEISGRENTLPIKIQTRLLHEQMATAIELSEVLRTQQAIGDRVNIILNVHLKNSGELELSNRLDLIKEQMAYDTTTISTIKEQLQN